MELKGACVQLFFLSAATIVVLATGTPLRADSPAQDGAVNQGFLFNGLFEGDLKLTEEEIRRNYRVNDEMSDGLRQGPGTGGSDSGHRKRASVRVHRAVTSDSSGNLWPDAVIRYDIDSDAPRELVETIYTAMEEWEHETCLRFLPRHSDYPDYVYFTTENVCDGDIGACCSDSVGRKGGEQKVSLHAPYCNSKGVIMHLIGHVIGFWHEESRPDRDDYISINYENVEPEAYHQFLKRNDLDVDYQGVGYDYGSVMHLPPNAFTKCHSFFYYCPTMEVNNYAEYVKQGQPSIGEWSHISDFDGEQASRLYSCPGSGVKGRLTISVVSGQHFPITGEDVYVKVTAVDKYGYNTIQRTAAQPSTASPTWNQELDFGEREWQFFRIRVYDDDADNDDAMSMSETVVIEGAANEYRDHCLTTKCTTSVRYLYTLVIDRGECSPNPCQNGGTCYELTNSFDGSATYLCDCLPGWTGTNCDSVPSCYSNPCQNGGTCHEFEDTSTYICYCPPDWTGTNCAIKLHCYSNPCQNGGTCIEDNSGYQCVCKPGWIGTTCGSMPPCSNNPCQHGTCNNVYYSGVYTYKCTCQPGWTGTNCHIQQHCYGNPCQNGGTCHEGASTYTCECPPGWTGKNCQVKVHCYGNPCQNGGTCHEGASTYTCECPPNWTGMICENELYCNSNPCQNGGTCREGASTYTCECPPDWAGTNCKKKVNCYGNLCQNGGTCREGVYTYTCECSSDWTGTYCQNIAQCYGNPCQNGGTCHEGTYTYTCECYPPWAGTNCEYRIFCTSYPCQSEGIPY